MNVIITVGAGATIIAMCSATFALITIGIDIVKNWRKSK